MKPCLRVNLRERRNGVPGYVPHDFLPAPDLDVGFDDEFGVSCFQEGGESFKPRGLRAWGE